MALGDVLACLLCVVSSRQTNVLRSAVFLWCSHFGGSGLCLWCASLPFLLQDFQTCFNPCFFNFHCSCSHCERCLGMGNFHAFSGFCCSHADWRVPCTVQHGGKLSGRGLSVQGGMLWHCFEHKLMHGPQNCSDGDVLVLPASCFLNFMLLKAFYRVYPHHKGKESFRLKPGAWICGTHVAGQMCCGWWSRHPLRLILHHCWIFLCVTVYLFHSFRNPEWQIVISLEIWSPLSAKISMSIVHVVHHNLVASVEGDTCHFSSFQLSTVAGQWVSAPLPCFD